MTKMYLKASITLSLLILLTGSYAQTVKLSLVTGKKYEVTTRTVLNSTLSVMGQDMENNGDNTTVQNIEVKETRANETDLSATTTKLEASVQTMGQEMSYDSDKKDNSGPLAETMGKMIGKVKNITIDATGKIIKEDKEDAETGMSAILGGGGASGIILMKEILIGKELKNGATWNDSVTTNSDKLKTTTVGTYTVSSINMENHSAIILFSGNQVSSGTMEQMGQEMAISSSSKVKSEYEIDFTTGVILKSTVNNDGTSTIDAQGMSIPVTLKTTVTSSVKFL